MELKFKMHTPNLLREVAECALAPKSGVLQKPLNILRMYLIEIAERASQLNDPILNHIMCQMTLYEIADPTSKEYDPTKLKEIERIANEHEKSCN